LKYNETSPNIMTNIVIKLVLDSLFFKLPSMKMKSVKQLNITRIAPIV
ncbi:unnamed protein product, partial [marine sediment metagenome]